MTARAASGGIAVMLAALVCFSALDTTTKLAAALVPVVMAVWVRYLMQVTITGAVVLPRRGVALFATRRPGMHVARGALMLTTNAIAFLSLREMHVGEFTAIVMLTPLLLTIVAAWHLGEHVSWLRWGCVLGGFVGTIVVIRPDRAALQWALLLPLVLVVAGAAFQVLTSRLARTDDPATMHFYTGLVGLIVTSLWLPMVWRPLAGSSWMLLGLMGLFGTFGHFLLILAYSRAPVAVLTPYLYTQIAFGALGGWLVFAHVPDAWSLAGIGLIAACGVFGTWLTGKEALARGRFAEAQSSIAAIASADAPTR